MNPRTLLVTGSGLLLLGLLLLLGVDNAAMSGGQQSVLLQGCLSNACSTVGAGLLVVAALVSALRRREVPEPPAVDHYS